VASGERPAPWIDSALLAGLESARELSLRRFFVENFPLGGDLDTLGRDDSLLEAGVIDSTGVLELIGFVEATYGIAVPDEDLLPENFDSIANVLGYLERRLTA
jgi:acyl carrier protein